MTATLKPRGVVALLGGELSVAIKCVISKGYFFVTHLLKIADLEDPERERCKKEVSLIV